MRIGQSGGALCAVLALGAAAIGCTAKSDVAATVPEEKAPHPVTLSETDKDGMTGPAASTTAKGAEGAMGNAHQFGMIGVLGGNQGAPAGTANTPGPSGFKPMDPYGQGAGVKALPPPPKTAYLDPNARYATTYRPGGAALAAFDAAVARGSIPVVYKDLVADFGARYAPAIPKPETGAMAFVVDTERAALGPSGGPLNLRIAMRSTDVAPSRAPLSVHLVLDVSGSMSGSAIENAKSAAETLVNKLDPQDDFSMVTFSSDARVLVDDGVIGPRRAQVLAKIHDVKADGGTNISAGLDLGYAQAHRPWIRGDAVKIVMLLSDGHANAGDTSASALSERSAHAFQDGIQTSTFGLGPDFDALLMSKIADRGAGGYYYLADSTQIAPALARELDARVQPVAQAIEIRVRLRPDVGATKVFGSRQLGDGEALQVRAQEIAADVNAQKKDGIRRDRQNDAEGGMRFFMPAFATNDRHAILLTLDIPQRNQGVGTGERPIASVEIRYKDRLTKQNVTREIPVRIRFAAGDEESAATLNASVATTAQAFAAGDAIVEAAQLVDRGMRAQAAALLNERADILQRASTAMNEPAFAEDAKRLLRLSGAMSGISDPMPLAVLLRGSAYGYLR